MPTKMFLIATTLSMTAIAPSLAASSTAPTAPSLIGWQIVEGMDFADVIRVKNDNGKGGGQKPLKAQGKGNSGKGNKAEKVAKDKPGKGGKPDKGPKADKVEKAAKAQNAARNDAKDKARGNEVERADKARGNGRNWSREEREIVSQRLMDVPAPQNRDMSRLLVAAPLAWLGQDVIFRDVDDEQLLTYRNCPPGLAKKDPPCVPPGLAKKGVSYDEWVGYDDDDLDRIYRDRLDRWDDFDRRDRDDYGFLLSSDQIARLYDLEPAPRGSRYALIDGMPVLLDNDDYSALALIREIARVPLLDNGVQVAPTAALTQREMMRTYRLPEPDAGYNYSVLNGDILALDDEAFETLQLIRIARAIF